MDDAIDLAELQASIRQVLDEECPIARLQHHLATRSDLDERLWKSISELGWLGLAVSEADGGLGLGLEALAVLYRELGRALAPVSVLGALLAADAIGRLGDAEQRARWLGGLISGDLQATTQDPFGEERLAARRDGDAIILDGSVTGLLDGDRADILVLNCEWDGSDAYVVADRGLEGVSVVRKDVADLTRHVADISFSGVRLPSTNLLRTGDGHAARHALAAHAAVAIGADALGAAEAGFANTVDYLKLREQFGKIIGSFQALKHRAADHKAALVGAEALLTAAAAGGGEVPSPHFAALEAKALAVSVALAVVQDSIQLHGGIGFTWEHSAHLYLRRVLLDSGLFGTVEEALDGFVRELAA